MSISHAERRQIENEMIFRRSNEKVGEDLDALDVLHEEEGNPELMRDHDLELDFKCECSDENCMTRITVPLTEYQAIHENRDTFIVMPDHQVDMIEKILKSTPTYNIVVKNHSTAEPSDELNSTTIDNS